jgi:hypothetical protein
MALILTGFIDFDNSKVQLATGNSLPLFYDAVIITGNDNGISNERA